MALRGTLTHWKTRLLATSLKMMPCQALGILESLWHVTAELAPSGNIGRLPNKAIAMEMFYEGDADELISALVQSGHLDENEEHRLIVHDWSQHADYNTKRKVSRRNESIINNDGSRLVMTRHESIPEPVPEPVPVKKPSRKRAADKVADPRHKPFRDLLEKAWKHKNPTLDMPWDESEGAQMSSILRASPSLDEENFKRLLNNWHRSDVNHGERPRAWIARITDYANGPIDRFGKPIVSAGPKVVPASPGNYSELDEIRERKRIALEEKQRQEAELANKAS